MMFSNQKAALLLEDGTVFMGKSGGVEGTCSGEICFNTGMTGYQEVFTDPSYFGQILVMTNAHIGNYGFKEEEIESDRVKISGLVCKNYSATYSRKMADGMLSDYLKAQNLVVIYDIDTRALVRHIRNKGAMNAIITTHVDKLDEMKAELKKIPSMEGLELASKVSTVEPYYFGDEQSPIRVAALDLGIKKNILRCLAERGCYIKVFPAKTSFEDMAAWKPDGYFISNGPGDPAPMDYAVETVKKIIENELPLFGICLGNQILGLACELKTYKLHHGHRGLNHPVLSHKSGLGEITSQNHGFSVSNEDIDTNLVEVTHANLNDDTVAGIRLKNKPAFAVQYHPESSAGPHDSRYLFDEFIELIKKHSQKTEYLTH